MRRQSGASIRLRLAASSAVIALVVLSAVAVLVAVQVRDAASRAATQLATDDLRPYAADLVHQPDEAPDVPASGMLVLIEGPDGSVRRDSMSSGLADTVRSVGRAENVTVAAGQFRVVRWTVSTSSGTWRLWAARDLSASNALLGGVLLTVLIGTPIAVLITTVAAWAVGTAALRPVERLRTSAERLRIPGSTGALPERGAGELAKLGSTLNGLIDDLRTSVFREQRVTADTAHELRTPLAVLGAQVELAQRTPTRSDLPGIRASVDRLIRLTDDLLVLSRAEANPMESVGASSVADLVTQAMDEVDRARLLAPRGVLVDLALDEVLDETGDAALDPIAWARILTNLVGNALAAGPESAVTVRLRTVRYSMVLEVSDDGPGVPDDFLPFAFDRFSRPAGARSNGAPGAGLGLALVKRLTERAGGTVSLSNGDPRGAVATVRVPLRTDAPSRRSS